MGRTILVLVFGQAAILYALYPIIGWPLIAVVALLVVAGAFWARPRLSRKADPFYDDYPDVG